MPATPPPIDRHPAGFGWRPQPLDRRDRIYFKVIPDIAQLPERVDLEAQLPAVYDQHAIGCHDEATELLTESGWTRWSRYDGHTPIATVNPVTHALEFQAPTALHVADYAGPMIVGQHGRLDFCVTPNHRMYLRKWDQRAKSLEQGYRFVPADRIGWYAGLLAAPSGFLGTQVDAVTVGRRMLSGDDLAAFLAVMAADGYAAAPEGTNPHRVGFCCFKPDRYEAVAALAARLGFGEQPSRKGVWYTRDEELAAWCRANLYADPALGARNKRVPAIIKTMTPGQIVRFLAFFGDKHDNGHNTNFYTSSRTMADDLQELLLRVGRRCSIHEDRPRDTVMRDGRAILADHCAMSYTLVEWSTEKLSLARKKDVGKVAYKGAVYCATVPNSTIVTRRNAQILISGNSCVGWSVAQLMRATMAQDGHRRPFMPSPVFLYRESRALDEAAGDRDAVAIDQGTYIRHALKAAAKVGLAPMSNLPPRYRPQDLPDPATWRFPEASAWRRQPAPSHYRDAERRQAVTYHALPLLEDMLGCLAAGRLFVFGFTVFRSLYAPWGPRRDVPDPQPGDRALGGHAVVAYGYDLRRQRLLIRNSWGREAHSDGPADPPGPNFTLSFDYVRNHADDAWCCVLVEGGRAP